MPSPRRRPPKPTERRTAGLRIQLTPTERATIEGNAAQSERNLSDYARDFLLSKTKAQPAPRLSPVALVVLRALVGQLVRLGNNVNQLARRANEQGNMPAQKTLDEMALILRLCVEKVLSL